MAGPFCNQTNLRAQLAEPALQRFIGIDLINVENVQRTEQEQSQAFGLSECSSSSLLYIGPPASATTHEWKPNDDGSAISQSKSS